MPRQMQSNVVQQQPQEEGGGKPPWMGLIGEVAGPLFGLDPTGQTVLSWLTGSGSIGDVVNVLAGGGQQQQGGQGQRQGLPPGLFQQGAGLGAGAGVTAGAPQGGSTVQPGGMNMTPPPNPMEQMFRGPLGPPTVPAYDPRRQRGGY